MPRCKQCSPSGPWVYTVAQSGKQYHAHFLTVCKRDAQCRWRVQFDGGTAHAAPSSVEPQLLPAQAPFTEADADDHTPIGGVAAAGAYLDAHAMAVDWKEAARGRSADSTLVYCVGELAGNSHQSTHAYVQIWQYDPKAANWRLRVLLINPLPRTNQ